MRILGLDVGEKRIGVARADSNTKIAIPVGTINVDGSEWEQIARLTRIQSTELIVLGLPRSNEGNETAQSTYVRNFAKTLKQKIPTARFFFQDESLTSVLAEERLKKRRKPYEKGEIDAEAASIILQDFLESFDLAKTEFTDEKIAEEDKGEMKIAKKKTKSATKWISGIAILAILGLIGTGGVLMIREKIRADRQAEYERIEAEAKAEVFSFTIRPGETIFEIKDNLRELGYSEQEIEEGFKAEYNFDFLKERPAGATLEGYLYGNTHEFYKTDDVKTILESFLEEMGEKISENQLKESYAAQGLTLYEGITLASVVQKEAPSPEQSTVAQVFLSRLNLGILLGSDVTVSYALDNIDYHREIYTDNTSALTVDSCYNTRLYGGLPCGPISNPGLSALLAVAHPNDSSYLYFLTGDDGMMYYSYTEDEHIRNIYSHCQVLCNVSL